MEDIEAGIIRVAEARTARLDTAARIAGLRTGAFYNRGRGDYTGGATTVITNIDARGSGNVVPELVASVISAAGVAGKILNNAVGKAYAGATP